MGGGPPCFPQGFSCLMVLRILPDSSQFPLLGFHILWPAFPKRFRYYDLSFCSPLPRSARTSVWAPSVSLAATTEITFVFSSSGYLDVSVRRVPFRILCIGIRMLGVFPSGFPHSDICGSLNMCFSPQLFAACHVFLRPSVPRHPPYALYV